MVDAATVTVGKSPRVKVTVAVTADFDTARRMDRALLVDSFLSQFRDGGQKWQREIQADPLLREIIEVDVRVDELT